MKVIERVAIISVACLILAFFVAIGLSSLGLPSWQPIDLPEQFTAATESAVTPNLEQYVRQKANQCSNESRDSYIAEARLINEAFEDAFQLAAGTSRITLSPIVADMQKQTRDLSAIDVDLCGEAVQRQMVAAYNTSIDIFLEFMTNKDSTGTEIYSVTHSLMTATESLEAYSTDIVWSVILNLLSGNEGELRLDEDAIPQIETSEDYCKEMAFAWKIYRDAREKTFPRFDITPGDDVNIPPLVQLLYPCVE